MSRAPTRNLTDEVNEAGTANLRQKNPPVRFLAQGDWYGKKTKLT
jgi:hypothetical protein